jgi:eight-cysteine-cluster-containing protein
MLRVISLLIVVNTAACKRPVADAALVSQTEPGVDLPSVERDVPPPPTPAALYAACEERVEGPQAADECSVDADCAAGGASGEICTTTEAVGELISTAEKRMCFAVLDTCGCTGGRCTWTLLDALPVGTVFPQVPGALPSSGGMLPQTGGALPQSGDSPLTLDHEE